MNSEETRQYVMKRHRTQWDWKPPFMMSGKRHPYLASLFRELGFTVGAEIGVASGHFSQQLCKGIPGLKLYSIDAWQSYGYYLATRPQASMEERYEKATKVLAPYNCEVIREFSHIAVERFEDDSLDFVHIDSNHDFEHVYQDITLWAEKVRPGGLVSMHDYLDTYDPAKNRVKEAVDQWTDEQEIFPWYIIVGSQSPTCFWIK